MKVCMSFNLKRGEQADRTSLWALMVWPSLTKVTSRKSSSSRMSEKAPVILDWKSFHRRQYCSVDPMLIGRCSLFFLTAAAMSVCVLFVSVNGQLGRLGWFCWHQTTPIVGSSSCGWKRRDLGVRFGCQGDRCQSTMQKVVLPISWASDLGIASR